MLFSCKVINEITNLFNEIISHFYDGGQITVNKIYFKNKNKKQAFINNSFLL